MSQPTKNTATSTSPATLPVIQSLPVRSLRRDGMQIRATMSDSHRDELAELFGPDGEWPSTLKPLMVFTDGQEYWLADGHHRAEAAQESGCDLVPCEIHDGGRVAALWAAISANSQHGLKRTQADKKAAVLKAFELDHSLSDREIARRAQVSHVMVAYTLREAGLRGATGNFTSETTRASTSTPPATAPVDTASPATETASAGTQPAPTGSTDPAPEYRTGADGRRINVARIGKAGKRTEGGDGQVGELPAAVDCIGIPISGEAAEAFFVSQEVDAIEKLMVEAQRRIGAVASRPGMELYRTEHLSSGRSRSADNPDAGRFHCPHVHNALVGLRHWKPYASVCPYCHKRGRQNSPDCTVCRGLPYLTRSDFERAPEELRKAVLAKVRQVERTAG